MKVEVLYVSHDGGTKKLADAISSVFGVEAKDLRNDVVVSDFDLLFIGSGNYGGKPAVEVVNFLSALRGVEDKKAAAFGAYSKSDKAITCMKALLHEKGMKVLGSWGCRGEFLFFNHGRPNEEDLADARSFAERIRQSAEKRCKKSQA